VAAHLGSLGRVLGRGADQAVPQPAAPHRARPSDLARLLVGGPGHAG
jgi:hypothetical protein